MATQTDNGFLEGKLALRRYFLRAYHADAKPKVFDACQGSGVLWKRLRAEFAVATYFGVDLKPKPGRLRMDSMRLLQLPDWDYDVIDIDTYGSPWKHWAALLANLRKPVTVFLTIGQLSVSRPPNAILQEMGITFWRKMPPLMGVSLKPMVLPLMLGKSLAMGFEVVDAKQVASTLNKTQYVGIRLDNHKD